MIGRSWPQKYNIRNAFLIGSFILLFSVHPIWNRIDWKRFEIKLKRVVLKDYCFMASNNFQNITSKKAQKKIKTNTEIKQRREQTHIESGISVASKTTNSANWLHDHARNVLMWYEYNWAKCTKLYQRITLIFIGSNVQCTLFISTIIIQIPSSLQKKMISRKVDRKICKLWSNDFWSRKNKVVRYEIKILSK